MKDNDKITLTFGQLQKLITEAYGDKYAKQKLYYDNQLQFEKWAEARGINDENNAEIYFDNIYCVDAVHGDRDIKGVKADGSMTWGQALAKIQKHFNIRGAAKHGVDVDGFVWEINEWVGDELKPRTLKRLFVDDSEEIFDSPEEAFEDGMEALNACPRKGNFQLVVLVNGDDYRADNFKYRAASKRNGKISVTKPDFADYDDRYEY